MAQQHRSMSHQVPSLPILALVDRVIVIEDGKVSIDGPRDEVMRKLGHPAPANV
jgi:ABC-type protease/lipase transport system fused ATPase/permease subunit